MRAILARELEGLALNHAAVLNENRQLHADALRVFGRWDSAVQAAGLDPTRVRRHRRWSAHAVVRRICEIAAEGKPLNLRAIQLFEATLASAAYRYFASWDEALLAAGLDPNEVRIYRKPWTRSELIAEIRRKHAAGEPLNAKDVKPDWIRRPACRLFGSWDGALRAAGLDPNEIRRNRRRGPR